MCVPIALRHHLAQRGVVLVQHDLHSRVVPDGRRELARDELEVRDRLVCDRELDPRVPELVQRIHDGQVGEPRELVDDDAERDLVAGRTVDLPQASLLLDVLQEDLPERRQPGSCRGSTAAGRTGLLPLEHVLEHDVGVVRVDHRREELVDRADEPGQHLVDLVPEPVDLGANLCGGLAIQRGAQHQSRARPCTCDSCSRLP